MMHLQSNHSRMFKKRMVFMVIAAWGCQLLAGPVWAAPQGGVVTSGAATISQSGNVTAINQATQKTAINWQSFGTKPQETVNFHQPNASAIALNRVIGNERSVLEGALNANGRVFLINSNGILFAKGSTVNTAGFLASALNLTDEDFNAGNYVFKRMASRGSVINQGTLSARGIGGGGGGGGYVALLGDKVSNEGVITATKGSVTLASGDRVTLNFNGDSLVNVTVDQGTLNALVENKEAVYADGGKVILTAKAADDLLSSQVNNSGIIEAKTIDDLKGSITLYAHGGTAAIDGTLDASAPITGDGGFIETSGDRVKIADTAFITTKSAAGTNGTWLIDPTDFTIGDGGDITGTLISNFLKGTDITIQSAMGTKGTEGNINVNDAVSWSADTTLALDAANNVNVNAAITATGENAKLALTAGKDINVNKDITLSGTNAALTMNYGGDYHIFMPTAYAGAVLDKNGRPTAKKAPEGTTYASITLPGSNAGLTMNGTPYTLIHKIGDMATTDTLTGSYALAQDLDAAAWSAANMGATSVVGKFNGTLTGLGHTISNLTLNAPSTNNAGLIGQIPSNTTAVVRDIGLVDIRVSGWISVGALVGRLEGELTVSRAYVTAGDNENNPSKVTGYNRVGGLVGDVRPGVPSLLSIGESYSDADVAVNGAGGNSIGGLVGRARLNATISNSHATGKVIGGWKSNETLGGLVAYGNNLTVRNSYATGVVSGASGAYVGGLVGHMLGGGAIENSFATGNVTGGNRIGGLVGDGGDGGGNIDNCWASGNVTATKAITGGTTTAGVGGLVGTGGGYITRSFATGNVMDISGASMTSMGGLVGYMLPGSITDSYATGSVTGKNSGMGGLVGRLNQASIENSFATGNVTNDWGGGYTGGLVGTNGGSITDSWASGNVYGGGTGTGGLAGISAGSITNCHATGNVRGADIETGGLVGAMFAGTITNSYALGDVTGTDIVGGLVGWFLSGSSIDGSYAGGCVTGTGQSVGGLVGLAVHHAAVIPSISNSYWNAGKSGQSNVVGKGATDVTITNTRGLTDSQWSDLPYYRDGTIDQVLADRAAAAARQAAFEAGARNLADSTVGQTMQRDTNPSSGAATLDEGQRQPSLDDHIVFADSADYGAHIKAISADGVYFDLEDDSDDRKKRKNE